MQPFFRTGRQGQIVDNAGAGGILSVIDVDTGKILTDGSDEKNHSFDRHPDSNIVYKGWQIPRWDDLLLLVKEIHLSLPKEFVYVGFDFALTKDGWDLIEGNWGQMLGQIAEQRGIKKEFNYFMGIC